MHNGECIPDVFLWALVCMSCLFAMLPSTTDKKKEKLFLSLATGVKLAEWKQTHWLSSRFFSKAERLCNCQQHRAKNIINFWIHPGTGELFPSTQWFPPRRLDANMCTHRNPLNCRHLKISHTHTHTPVYSPVSHKHTYRHWLHLWKCISGEFQPAWVCKTASRLPLITSQTIIGEWSNYFLLPMGNTGGYKLKMIPTHGLDSRLQSNSPLPCVTAYHCAITMSEKIVHLTLPPPSHKILVIYHHVVFLLPQCKGKKKTRIGWVWLKFLASY